MVWFITQVRRHAILGMVRSTWPLLSNDQFFMRCSSFAEATAARASLTSLSNPARSSLEVLGAGGMAICTPFGAMSSESSLMVMLAQDGMLARCPASHAMDPDFSCGFQENLASGTRS